MYANESSIFDNPFWAPEDEIDREVRETDALLRQFNIGDVEDEIEFNVE